MLSDVAYCHVVTALRPVLGVALAMLTAVSAAPAQTEAPHDWARTLRTWGYVALIVDSFGPRGKTNICRGTLERRRAIRTNAGRLRREIVSGGPAVRGSPPVNAPLLILIGEEDDWTPASNCRRLVRQTEQFEPTSAARITLEVYPGAHHGFDWGEPPRSMYGHMVGGHPEAAADAKAEVVLLRNRTSNSWTWSGRMRPNGTPSHRDPGFLEKATRVLQSLELSGSLAGSIHMIFRPKGAAYER